MLQALGGLLGGKSGALKTIAKVVDEIHTAEEEKLDKKRLMHRLQQKLAEKQLTPEDRDSNSSNENELNYICISDGCTHHHLNSGHAVYIIKTLNLLITDNLSSLEYAHLKHTRV